MPVPQPIGPIHFDEPRAVKVRDSDELSTIHSAVSGRLHVYVSTVLEAEAVLKSWRVIMQAAADQAEQVLSELRTSEASVT